jgi:hypothetical protein
MITLSKLFVHNINMITANIDTELVMMDADRGAYFGLDEIGTRIWNMLAEPQSLVQLCDKLVEEYEVERATCEQDVSQLLSQMQAQNLILVAE